MNRKTKPADATQATPPAKELLAKLLGVADADPDVPLQAEAPPGFKIVKQRIVEIKAEQLIGKRKYRSMITRPKAGDDAWFKSDTHAIAALERVCRSNGYNAVLKTHFDLDGSLDGITDEPKIRLAYALAAVIEPSDE